MTRRQLSDPPDTRILVRAAVLGAGIALVSGCKHRVVGDPPTCGPCCHGAYAGCEDELRVPDDSPEVTDEEQRAQVTDAPRDTEATPDDAERGADTDGSPTSGAPEDQATPTGQDPEV